MDGEAAGRRLGAAERLLGRADAGRDAQRERQRVLAADAADALAPGSATSEPESARDAYPRTITPADACGAGEGR